MKTKDLEGDLRILAWEVTRRCNLSCAHCRASAEAGPYPDELTTDECFAMVDEVASFAKPLLILSGGEPLLREDIFEIASHATERGLRVVLATNGVLLDRATARYLLDAGVKRVSLSVDGSCAATHDRLRGVPGAFDKVMAAIESCKAEGLPFQINSTITARNLNEIEAIAEMAVQLGAAALHLFLLVPTGRGEGLAGEQVSAEDYERVLSWLADQQQILPIQMKATCAPQYQRIIRERSTGKDKEKAEGQHHLDRVTGGCLGGKSFCFVSHTGTLSPCGYLELDCGNVRREGFRAAWEDSEIFCKLRDPDLYEGKCGHCEYRHVCGGCRARAYAASGDYLDEEPLCMYQPVAVCNP